MSKCRKCHLRETKFAKFPGGACPQTPLEARAVGARLSAFGANRASLFLLKRGWNVCLGELVFRPSKTRELSTWINIFWLVNHISVDIIWGTSFHIYNLFVWRLDVQPLREVFDVKSSLFRRLAFCSSIPHPTKVFGIPYFSSA